MNEYEEIRENLENPNDKKLRDWLENNWLMLRKFFNATTEAIIKDDDFDFFMDLDYKVYKLIFGLFSRLAPTPKNAEVIHCIFENFSDVLLNKLRDTPLTDQDKITELLKKWHNKQDIQHKDYLYFYEHRYDYDTTCDSKFTKIEKKCGREDDYISCRFYLALMLTRSDEFEDFENSEDVALRMVFYKEYNFNWNEESYLTHEKLKAYYERDGKLALDYIIDNPSIYHRNEHLKLIIGNTGHIPTLNRIMENYDKVKQ